MRWTYRTLQVPQSWGTGAFMPVPAQINTASSNGQNKVFGAPGTMAVASPRPAALSDGELGGPYNQPSSVSPNVIYPSIYVVIPNNTMTMDGLGTGLTRGNDHPAPVAAIAPNAIPGNFSHRVRVGGRTVTRATRPFTQWRDYSGKKS